MTHSIEMLLARNMKSFYFACTFFCLLTLLCAEELKKPDCIAKEEALSLLKTASDFLTNAKDAFSTCKDQKENFEFKKPKDCTEILASGFNQSGVYTIWPRESCRIFNQLQVYCDMYTDYGGWTVIQRRGKYPVQIDFEQDWQTYVNGFGNISAEFWLGNENIRVLCHKGCEIRFDLRDNDHNEGFAVYRNFNLTRSSYTIYVSHYVGNVGDSLTSHNDWSFSTWDKGSLETIIQPHGGWWHNAGKNVSLNGLYQPGESGYGGIIWQSWRGKQCLARTEIKVRPK